MSFMTDLDSDAYAQARDAADALRHFRDEFHLPLHDGAPQAYFVGNSLGLQPKGARAHVEEVLDKWATEAVEGHFTGDSQWMTYHELVRDLSRRGRRASARGGGDDSLTATCT